MPSTPAFATPTLTVHIQTFGQQTLHRRVVSAPHRLEKLAGNGGARSVDGGGGVGVAE
jgi:hypothetical protein